MMNKKNISIALSLIFFLHLAVIPFHAYPSVTAEEATQEESQPAQEETSTAADGPLTMRSQPMLTVPEDYPKKFIYDSGVSIPYPEDGVKGIYVSKQAVNNDQQMQHLVDLIDQTDLNAMVMDVKDETGDILFNFESEDSQIQEHTNNPTQNKDLIKKLEKKSIYPIARISTFKDSKLSKEKPELSFTNPDGSLWTNAEEEAYTNPYLQEVWDYNIQLAIEAAKIGFKEIQFDNVQFPDGFETFASNLVFDKGEYDPLNDDPSQFQVQAITDFVTYAKEELKAYDVEVSINIPGYTTTQLENSGIGQNFLQLADLVDVISSTIYPSQWEPGYFNLTTPDLNPYDATAGYIQIENDSLSELEQPARSRPWLQDFTADHLGPGMYMTYGVEEVEAQIHALQDNGIHEFILYNPDSDYTVGVDYTPGENTQTSAEEADESESENKSLFP